MCGRLACTLAPDELCKACAYKPPGFKEYKLPEWRVSDGKYSYTPSYNISPSQTTPVLVRKKLLDPNCSDEERLIIPMIWGLIPFFCKEDFKHAIKLHNARSETVQSKPSFAPAFRRGQRCVALCDGFYEWQLANHRKLPFLIYLEQPENVTWEDRFNWDMSWDEKSGWHGPRVLPMAAIFDEWKSPEGEKYLCYSILTMPSYGEVEKIHDRVPVILDTEQKVECWLNAKTDKQAFTAIQASDHLALHQVTGAVGHTNFDGPECVKSVKIGVLPPNSVFSAWCKEKNVPKSWMPEDEQVVPIKMEPKSPTSSANSGGLKQGNAVTSKKCELKRVIPKKTTPDSKKYGNITNYFTITGPSTSSDSSIPKKNNDVVTSKTSELVSNNLKFRKCESVASTSKKGSSTETKTYDLPVSTSKKGNFKDFETYSFTSSSSKNNTMLSKIPNSDCSVANTEHSKKRKLIPSEKGSSFIYEPAKYPKTDPQKQK